MQTKSPCFKTASHAISWSTEILRAKQNPQVANIYQKLKEMNEGLPKSFYTPDPKQLDQLDKFHMALDIDKAMRQTLTAENVQILRLYYWGDYATPQRLQQARKMQEACRREGKRVRLNWRYSFRQIATVTKISDKTIAKRMQQAEEELEKTLQKLGYVAV